MTLDSFKGSLAFDVPPKGLSVHFQALWYDAKGNWDAAHGLIDQLTDSMSAHVHAYLHRKEGDEWNANYWYRRANRALPQKSLEEEWEDLFVLLSETAER
ncbi:hypothetical protein H8S90_21645 [Olivibacter sp. SDN3]|nr:hypothetical protein H8S90_21645 [Olivibacter sp. SDN3]